MFVVSMGHTPILVASNLDGVCDFGITLSSRWDEKRLPWFLGDLKEMCQLVIPSSQVNHRIVKQH
jgi:hypothetical protein